MNASTLSAFAAAAAAVVAATVAGIQLFIGRKQAEAALISARAALMNAQNAGRHTLAEFRQKWIDKVIDTLCEHHSIVMARAPDQELSASDERALTAARTKLEILLNPREPQTVALLQKIDSIAHSATVDQRESSAAEMLVVARDLLKLEWKRIKNELA